LDTDELTSWALANGWQMIGGNPRLTKPSSPNEAIVRVMFKVAFAPWRSKCRTGWRPTRSSVFSSRRTGMAKRDAPNVAQDAWHFPCPAGPKERYIPYNYCFYGAWSFGKNKTAAKELITYLQERPQLEARDVSRATGIASRPTL
jgi:hypothetical protein